VFFIVLVWVAATGRKLLAFIGHTDGVESVAFSPDGKRIVTGSKDNTVRVWHATTGQEVLTLRGHTSTVAYVCFSPGGLLATGDSRGILKIWDSGKGPNGPLP